MSRFSCLLTVLAVGMVRRSRCFTLIPQSSPVCGYSSCSDHAFKPLTLQTAFSIHKIRKIRSSCCSSQYDSQDDDKIIATTEEWLKQWVIGLQLCPWASSVGKNNGMRLIILRGSSESIESHVATVIDEAHALEKKWHELRGASFPTTLMVFPDPSYMGDADGLPCGAFPVKPRTRKRHHSPA